MKKVFGFYRLFLQTLNPESYEGFAESRAKNSFNYFATLIFNAIVIMLLVMMPMLVQLPKTIEANFFDKFDAFTMTPEMKTSSPILIPKGNPLILINYANETPTQSANVIINNDVLSTGMLFTQITKDFSSYRFVKDKKAEISNIIAFLFLMMIPTLLLVFYFYNLIWFFAVVLIATLGALIIAPILKHRVSAKKLFNCAMYGISLTVVLDLIFFALGFKFYYIQYLPLVIFMIAGIYKTGMKVDSKQKNKYYEIKE